MSNKLRFVDWNPWPVEYISPFWELPRWVEPLEQTLVIGSPSEDYLGFLSTDSPETMIYTENLPPDLPKVRYWVPKEMKGGGIGIMGSDDLLIFGHFSKDKDVSKLVKILLSSVATALAGSGIKVQLSPYRPNANDLYIQIGDKLKKCFGCGFIDMGDWYTLTSMLTFDFRIDLIRKLWRLDGEKIIKKGDVSDMADIVGGLSEIAPDIDKNKVANDIAVELAKRLNLDLSVGQFTDVEMQKMDELKPTLNSDKWFFNLER
ncbi:MAG: hypothetical protein KAS32_13060 [Candidatus Peribacteraceae bacterium]|nr:hypothetical protein [Candidatus Peribacteraceae bacterium]